MNPCVTRRVTVRAAAQAQCRRWKGNARPPPQKAKPKVTPKTAPRPPEPNPLYHIPGAQAAPRQRERFTPPPPPPKDDTVLSLWRTSWIPLSGAALIAGALGFYIFGTAAATLKSGGAPCACASEPESEHATPTGRPPALTGDNAEQFDKELNWPEWWMGITSLRRRLVEHATGDVLELAMGSGRNFEYYNWSPIANALEAAVAETTDDTEQDKEARVARMKKAVLLERQGITSFTGLDISVDMLDVARRKLTKTVPPLKSSEPVVRASSMASHTGGQLSFLEGRLRLVHSDAHAALPAAPSLSSYASTLTKPPPSSALRDGKYDSIIQTFGLCSVSDPVAVLCNLASAVKPGTGRIVLLEHGKGFSGLVNGLLDRNAGRHFAKYGCWWNRDIEGIAEEAARRTPGLTIVKVERPKVLQMGTLVWVELKVEEDAALAAAKAKEKEAEGAKGGRLWGILG